MTQKHTIYSSCMKLWAKMSEINLQFIFFPEEPPRHFRGPTGVASLHVASPQYCIWLTETSQSYDHLNNTLCFYGLEKKPVIAKFEI